VDEAIERIDAIIARRGECLIGGPVMEQVLRVDTEPLVDELRTRGYVVRGIGKGGYVVYPRRTGHIGPHMIIEVI
jgi:hypothetical protein